MICKENHHSNRTFFQRLLANAKCRNSERPAVLTPQVFHHQITANLPLNATEIVRFLKCVRYLFSLKKSWVFLRTTRIFFQNQKGGKFAVEYSRHMRIRCNIFKKCLFHLNCDVFHRKVSGKFQIWKIRKFD